MEDDVGELRGSATSPEQRRRTIKLASSTKREAVVRKDSPLRNRSAVTEAPMRVAWMGSRALSA